MKRTLPGALKFGVGYTGLMAVISFALAAMSDAGQLVADRFGTGLTVIDVGWGTISSVAFSWAYTIPIIAGLVLANALLVSIGVFKTLNVDIFNQWQYVFTMMIVLVITKSWPLAILTLLIMWFVSIKMGDWIAPFIQKYYGMPQITVAHFPTVIWAPIGFALDKLWDKIPGIRNITWDADTIKEKFGFFGEPTFIGFAVGIIFGLFAYIGNPEAGSVGDQVTSMITLGLDLAFFVVILPRCTELLVAGLVPLSQGIQQFVTKRMPGRNFYIGLDVAVCVGKTEHVALGALLVPILYLVAIILPGNRVLPMADAAGFMIFYSVFLLNTNKGNLFRAILNCVLVALPFTLWVSNLFIPVYSEVADFVGFELPAAEVSSLSPAANIFMWMFYEFSNAITSGFGTGAVLAIAALVVYIILFRAVKNRPAEIAAGKDE